MVRVYYFSGSGHSRTVAEALANELGASLSPLENTNVASLTAERALIVFPVYSQSLPTPLKAWLPRIRAKKIALIATYGAMSHGNALWEAAQLLSGELIGAAAFPTGHTYRNDVSSPNLAALSPLLARLRELTPPTVFLPKEKKHPLAGFFPAARHRLGVRILHRRDLCNGCNRCTERCPTHAMRCGTIRPRTCIRCSRCVSECPQHALFIRLHPAMHRYLKHPRSTDVTLYLD